MIERLIQLWQEIYYGLLKNKPNIDFTQIPNQFSFETFYDKKNKVYWIEAKDMSDFVVSGKTKQELTRHIYDTLTAYYDIPTYFAKRLKPPQAEAVFHDKHNKEEVITVNYKEELDKVLA